MNLLLNLLVALVIGLVVFYLADIFVAYKLAAACGVLAGLLVFLGGGVDGIRGRV